MYTHPQIKTSYMVIACKQEPLTHTPSYLACIITCNITGVSPLLIKNLGFSHTNDSTVAASPVSMAFLRLVSSCGLGPLKGLLSTDTPVPSVAMAPFPF